MYIFSCYLLFAINHQVTCPREWLLLQLESRNERYTELELQWLNGAIQEINVCCSDPQCLGLFVTLTKLTKTLYDVCTRPTPTPAPAKTGMDVGQAKLLGYQLLKTLLRKWQEKLRPKACKIII